MVAKTNILTRVDRNLDTAAAMIAALPTVATEWDLAAIFNHAWDMEWHEAMDRLYTVHKARADGLLRSDQEDRYQAVVADLKRLLPTVQRLELHMPRFPLDT